MLSLNLVSAVAAATLLSMVSAQSKTTAVQYETAPTEIAVNALTDVGCFNSSEPLVMNGEYRAQSRGNCKFICVYLKKNVMATSDGTKCWCGDYVPPKANKISNSSCDTGCGGYPLEKCMLILRRDSYYQDTNHEHQVVDSIPFGYNSLVFL